jgi:hypothetical protein
MLLPDVSTRKQNTDAVILQIPSSLCPVSNYEVTNTQKQPRDSHQMNNKKSRQLDIVWCVFPIWMDYIYLLENNT